MVDANLAPIILLSCTNNLYFICFQLLNIFKYEIQMLNIYKLTATIVFYIYSSMPFLINYLYFWYSLLYLIGRTTCAFLCAASIHDASRKPLDFFRHTSSSGWCQEVKNNIKYNKNMSIFDYLISWHSWSASANRLAPNKMRCLA